MACLLHIKDHRFYRRICMSKDTINQHCLRRWNVFATDNVKIPEGRLGGARWYTYLLFCPCCRCFRRNHHTKVQVCYNVCEYGQVRHASQDILVSMLSTHLGHPFMAVWSPTSAAPSWQRLLIIFFVTYEARIMGICTQDKMNSVPCLVFKMSLKDARRHSDLALSPNKRFVKSAKEKVCAYS